MKPVLVIGIGNDLRGDDAAGLLVARRLHALDMTVCEQSGEGTALMRAWQGWPHVIVVDAVCSDMAPGTIYRFEASSRRLPAALFSLSTHGFGLAEAVELARVLHELPPRLVVYAIEGRQFAMGSRMSGPVRHALEYVTDSIRHEVEAGTQPVQAAGSGGGTALLPDVQGAG